MYKPAKNRRRGASYTTGTFYLLEGEERKKALRLLSVKGV